MDGDGTTKLEFAVQMSCRSCEDAVKKALHGVPGVLGVQVDLAKEQVLVDTVLPSAQVQSLIETTGKRAVLRGIGPTQGGPLGAAVAQLSGDGAVRGAVLGVVRFVQLSPLTCAIEGTVDGLRPGPHGLHVHEFGDLTNGCFSCGGHFNPHRSNHGSPDDPNSHVGDLGNITADEHGRASFRVSSGKIKVGDIIGRSVVVDETADDLGRGTHPLSKVTGNSGPGLACGIIARSAGLFENSKKKICTCDGVTLWDERDRPVAGPGRQGQQPAHTANL
ncbi:copper chaperone for superoxide dismutase [Lethenteron reissneri]|uniref:copper chaperone for superoxide dismutase n=1 Tax=Lethenteron reissneri TaxID=7753 RepID=UPI002AB60694|nr:copper chaperone for superoxide dismutase [Lethenteron reissneri]